MLALSTEPFVYNAVFLSFKTRLIGKAENACNAFPNREDILTCVKGATARIFPASS